jgi:hypothetical protein
MIRKFGYLSCLLALPLTLVGCVAQNITPEQRASEAVLVSDISMDGQNICQSPGDPVSCLFLGYVDDKPLTLANPTITVMPGIHRIGSVWSHGLIHSLPPQPTIFAPFNYQAGHRYVLSPGVIVDRSWDAPYPVIATYVMYDGSFVERGEVERIETTKAQADERAFRAQQQQDMSRIMQKGAEVCLRAAGGVVANHGYVEDVANGKIEIHLSNWQGNDRDIWTFPGNWYLCGGN